MKGGGFRTYADSGSELVFVPDIDARAGPTSLLIECSGNNFDPSQINTFRSAPDLPFPVKRNAVMFPPP